MLSSPSLRVVVLAVLAACSSRQDAGDSPEGGQGGQGGSDVSDGGAGGGDAAGAGGHTATGEGGGAGNGSGGSAAGSSGAGGKGGAAGGNAAGSGGALAATGGNAAGSAGTGGAGVSAAECSKLTNCDTFESYAAGKTPGGPWTGFEINGGSLAVDETRGFAGSKKSIKVSVTPGGAMQARMKHNGTGVLPADDLFVRMMIYIDAPPKGSFGHWNWMSGEGNVSQKSGGKLSNAFIASGGNFTGGTWMLYGGGGSGGYQDCFSNAPTVLPTKKWACVEFEIDSKSNSARSWIDGVLDEVVGIENGLPLVGGCLPGHDFTSGMWYIPRVDTVHVGFSMAHELAATATAWLDDVAIATKRIGCPAL